MDEILVMKQGKIIARGTHGELLASSGYYRETWELQQHNLPSQNKLSKIVEVKV